MEKKKKQYLIYQFGIPISHNAFTRSSAHHRQTAARRLKQDAQTLGDNQKINEPMANRNKKIAITRKHKA